MRTRDKILIALLVFIALYRLLKWASDGFEGGIFILPAVSINVLIWFLALKLTFFLYDKLISKKVDKR